MLYFTILTFRGPPPLPLLSFSQPRTIAFALVQRDLSVSRMQTVADGEAAARAWSEVESMRSHLQVEATAIVAAAREAEQRATEAEEDKEELLVRVQRIEEEKVRNSN